MIRQLEIRVGRRGLHDITARVAEAIDDMLAAGASGEGLCTVFIRHTSASLLIQENADPSARRDLERFFDRLAPEHDPLYTHRSEGPDDMPAHVKAALTTTSLGIPLTEGKLLLGTWQGIYLWEHRRIRSRRRLVIHLGP